MDSIHSFANLQFIDCGIANESTLPSLAITDCPELLSVVIRMNSFYRVKEEFSIQRCPKLQSIHIEKNCFKKTKVIQFSNLPQLVTLSLASLSCSSASLSLTSILSSLISYRFTFFKTFMYWTSVHSGV